MCEREKEGLRNFKLKRNASGGGSAPTSWCSRAGELVEGGGDLAVAAGGGVLLGHGRLAADKEQGGEDRGPAAGGRGVLQALAV